MVVTIKGKLLLTDDEKKILLQTLATINSASNWLSQKVRRGCSEIPVGGALAPKIA